MANSDGIYKITNNLIEIKKNLLIGANIHTFPATLEEASMGP